MKSSVKKLSDFKFEVSCEIDPKDWSSAQSKAKAKAIKNLQVKGFRKGHVPEAIANKSLNQGEVFNDAVNAILPETFTKAMEENKLTPYIKPTVNVDKLTNSELTIRFTVIVEPTCTLGNYKGIKIEKKKVEVSDKEIDDSINKLLEQNAELIVKNGEAKKGDTVIIDFDGFVDGKAFEGGSAKNYELALGSGQFVPGFEDQLIGCKANDEKDVNVTFPEQYVENLKGKKATFKCKVHEVKEKKIPSLNDETVKDLEIKNVNTVDQLKAHQKEEITKRKTVDVENAYYSSLIDKITGDSKIVIADEIIEEEANAMKENLVKQVEQNGLKWNQYIQITGKKEEDLAKEFKISAKKNIANFIVLNEIAKAEKINVTPEDVQAEYKRIADLYHMEVKKVEEILSKNLNDLVNQIKSTKIHDLLIKLNK